MLSKNSGRCGHVDSEAIALLKTVIDYDHETGEITWRSHKNHERVGASAVHVTKANRGYLRGDVFYKSKIYKAGKLAWAFHYGEWPSLIVDHINGNSLDNRISNLRLVTPRENALNRCVSSNSASGKMGVHWAKSENKWRACIVVNDKNIHLGYFKPHEFDLACAARDAAEKKYGFHPNHGRKPIDSEEILSMTQRSAGDE
jgi:hypothetical protein